MFKNKMKTYSVSEFCNLTKEVNQSKTGDILNSKALTYVLGIAVVGSIPLVVKSIDASFSTAANISLLEASLAETGEVLLDFTRNVSIGGITLIAIKDVVQSVISKVNQ